MHVFCKNRQLLLPKHFSFSTNIQFDDTLKSLIKGTSHDT